MRLFCRNKLTRLQRRSMGWVSVVMLFTVAANLLTLFSPTDPLIQIFPFLSVLLIHPGHALLWQVVLLSVLTLLPVLLAVFVASHYLAREPDEFIRAMVTRALLWGLAITMAGDAVLGALMMSYGKPFPVGLLNVDLFVIGAGVSFRLVTWRYSR